MRWFLALGVLFVCMACQEQATQENKAVQVVEEIKTSVAATKAELEAKGYQIFDYVDEKTKDTVLMQQYFIAF